MAKINKVSAYGWSTHRADWPDHLRDAPHERCDTCGRYTWNPALFGAECRAPMPVSGACAGRFQPLDS